MFAVLKKIIPEEKLKMGIRPFKKVCRGQVISHVGQEERLAEVNFYPVLPRSKSYPDFLCFMAKKCYYFGRR